MADTDRAEAQQRRADSRRQRRDAEDGGGSSEPADTAHPNGGPDDQPHAAIRNAAKAAAAGAALGAAVGAALAARGAPSEDGDDAAPRDATESHGGETGVQEQEAQPEADVEGEEREQLDDEPTAVAEAPEAPEADEPAVEAPRDEPRARQPDAGTPRQGASPDETADVARRAREQLQALQGREPESVSALERTAEGWTVSVEVVEVPRVPDSTDVMASYELQLDKDKNLIRYSRRRRYYRSQADRGDD